MPAQKKPRRLLPFLFPVLLFLYAFLAPSRRDEFPASLAAQPPARAPELIYYETKFNGLGSQLLRILDAAALANATRAKLCVHQPRYWNYGCAPYHGWGCYFDTLHPVTIACDNPAECPSLADLSLHQFYDAKCVTIDKRAAPRAAAILPSLREARRLAKDIWRFNAATGRAISAVIKEVALSHVYVGVHIRRGDKAREVRPVPLEKYAHVLRLLNAAEVFVATDDGTVIEQLKALIHPIPVHYIPGATLRRGHEQAAFNSRYMKSNYMPVVELFAEMEILRRAQYFVGTFSSNLARWVHVLREYPANTTISLDDRWAPGVAWRTFGKPYCKDPDANRVICKR